MPPNPLTSTLQESLHDTVSTTDGTPAFTGQGTVQTGAEAQRKTVRIPWRTACNFWLDFVLACVFSMLLTVTTIAQTVFPVGPGAEGWTLWGGDLLAWRGLEFGLLCVLGAGIVAHLMLHWDWVCQVSSQILFRRRLAPDNGLRTIYGVVLLMGLLIFIASLLVAAEIMIEPPPGSEKVLAPIPH
jgi:hypothetical protein